MILESGNAGHDDRKHRVKFCGASGTDWFQFLLALTAGTEAG